MLCICTNLIKNGSSLSVCTIEDPFVVIQPDLSQADQVAGDNRGSIGESVGALFAKNMPYNRAWNNLQLTSTLPDLQWRGHTAQGKKLLPYTYFEKHWKPLTLKDISKFSPPQNSIWSSYVPICSKYDLDTENRPPAKVGVLQNPKKIGHIQRPSRHHSCLRVGEDKRESVNLALNKGKTKSAYQLL